MNERQKLDEASYFLAKMKEVVGNVEETRYNLSAFLSASRSCLQYSLEEARPKQGGQAWYDGQVTSAKAVRFLIDKRDENIHVEPLKFRQDVTVHVGGAVLLTGRLGIKLRRGDGSFVEIPGRPDAPTDEPIQVESASGHVEYRVAFDDWGGPENLVELCELYLNELRVIVEDGVGKGFLPG